MLIKYLVTERVPNVSWVLFFGENFKSENEFSLRECFFLLRWIMEAEIEKVW